MPKRRPATRRSKTTTSPATSDSTAPGKETTDKVIPPAENEPTDEDDVDVDAPDVDAPDAPDVDVPDVDAPDLDAPDLDVPDLDAPDLDAPDVDADPEAQEAGDDVMESEQDETNDDAEDNIDSDSADVGTEQVAGVQGDVLIALPTSILWVHFGLLVGLVVSFVVFVSLAVQLFDLSSISISFDDKGLTPERSKEAEALLQQASQRALVAKLGVLRVTGALIGAFIMFALGTMLVSAVMFGTRHPNGLWGVAAAQRNQLMPGIVVFGIGAILLLSALMVNVESGTVTDTTQIETLIDVMRDTVKANDSASN